MPHEVLWVLRLISVSYNSLIAGLAPAQVPRANPACTRLSLTLSLQNWSFLDENQPGRRQSLPVKLVLRKLQLKNAILKKKSERNKNRHFSLKFLVSRVNHYYPDYSLQNYIQFRL
jgi:hypothetical protein